MGLNLQARGESVVRHAAGRHTRCCGRVYMHLVTSWHFVRLLQSLCRITVQQSRILSVQHMCCTATATASQLSCKHRAAQQRGKQARKLRRDSASRCLTTESGMRGYWICHGGIRRGQSGYGYRRQNTGSRLPEAGCVVRMRVQRCHGVQTTRLDAAKPPMPKGGRLGRWPSDKDSFSRSMSGSGKRDTERGRWHRELEAGSRKQEATAGSEGGIRIRTPIWSGVAGASVVPLLAGCIGRRLRDFWFAFSERPAPSRSGTPLPAEPLPCRQWEAFAVLPQGLAGTAGCLLPNNGGTHVKLCCHCIAAEHFANCNAKNFAMPTGWCQQHQAVTPLQYALHVARCLLQASIHRVFQLWVSTKVVDHWSVMTCTLVNNLYKQQQAATPSEYALYVARCLLASVRCALQL